MYILDFMKESRDVHHINGFTDIKFKFDNGKENINNCGIRGDSNKRCVFYYQPGRTKRNLLKTTLSSRPSHILV